MSLTDTQFTYISRSDSGSLPRIGPARPEIRASAAATRRSSSVKSPRQRHVVRSRDAAVAALCWSRRWFSVQKLAREFDRQFPVLVRVMQGYRCSEVNGLRLNVGQVGQLTNT